MEKYRTQEEASSDKKSVGDNGVPKRFEEEQEKELKWLETEYPSLTRMIDKETSRNGFSLKLGPFPESNIAMAKLNKIYVTLQIWLNPQYPYDSFEVEVTPIRGLKPMEARSLKRFLENKGNTNSKTVMSLILKAARDWLMDKNNYLLTYKERAKIVPEKALPPPKVVNELDVFELEGKKLLVNLCAASFIEETKYDMIFTEILITHISTALNS
eukprot:TRINITY_DN11786_c0_g1_i1.p1 TRINITY_DN11786_c0_g1~~TRINITY_DN11786_c0_g1_i1.p1  ORF type:complete len:214 (+),score=48.53 TRINITY_DN11786_c0_g1_i1:94-735(+)